MGGLEWMMKFTQVAQADLYVAAQAQFERSRTIPSSSASIRVKIRGQSP